VIGVVLDVVRQTFRLQLLRTLRDVALLYMQSTTLTNEARSWIVLHDQTSQLSDQPNGNSQQTSHFPIDQ
jgi:hypothetical protein